ncbi:MAG: hypothetical protein M3Q29_15675 [Chloroflexota bacterium]|nr:hypothetical protein [Chloroflexota bacterium]
MRYRMPSLKTALGITKAKKRAKKKLGITAAMKPLRARGNYERRLKRRVGYYSEPMKMFRLIRRLLK